MTEYIPIGNDCSLAYNLQKLNLRKNAYPFDWIRLNNLDDLINILSNDFNDFIDRELLNINELSDKFPCLEDDWSDEISKNIIIKHNKYSVIFPHEIKSDKDIVNEIDNFIKKYERRINRFRRIILDKDIKKVFVRISNKTEDISKLDNFLKTKCDNYEIKFIKLDKKNKFSSWKKEELDWNKIYI